MDNVGKTPVHGQAPKYLSWARSISVIISSNLRTGKFSNFLSNKPSNNTTLTNVPQFQNIYFNNLVCDYAGEAIRINGLPYAPVSDVFFNNVSIKAAQQYLIDNTSNVSTSTVSYTYAQELGLVPHYGVDGPA